MPRYYFEVEAFDFVDQEGTELPNLEEAEAEARAAVFDLCEGWAGDSLTLLVKGANRRTVMRVGLQVTIDRVSG
jgi:hypothetical protein